MKLGLHVGYWGAGPPADATSAIAEAERLGFDSVWTAEAYGSDALTPLAWWGSTTSRVRLGTDLIQMSARTPTATAMAAITLEGWYGQPFPKPLARTREYVSVVRQVLARKEPVTSAGEHYPLPYPGGTGLGKPLKSIVHPLRSDIPIVLGAEGPKNVALAAEIADGWFPIYYSPRREEVYRDALAEGFARPGARRQPNDFEILAMVPVIMGEDVERAADFMRPTLALYIGGMGAREMNFHYDVFVRMGYEEAADKIQQLYLDGHKDEAAAVVPTELIEEVALIGPRAKIKDDLEAWTSSRVTTILLGGTSVPTMQTMAELVL